MDLVRDPIERATAASDLALALAAGAGAAWAGAAGGGASIRLGAWTVVLGSLAAGAGAGAAVHGLSPAPRARRLLWGAIFAALAVNLAALLAAAALDSGASGGVATAVGAGYGALCTVMLALRPRFRTFVLLEALALIAAIAVYDALAFRGALPGAGRIASGLLVSLFAGGAQAARRPRRPWFGVFDHNGVFHLVQTVGTALIAAGVTHR